MMKDLFLLDVRGWGKGEGARRPIQSHAFVAHRDDGWLQKVSKFSDRIVNVLRVYDNLVLIEVNALSFRSFLGDERVGDAERRDLAIVGSVVLSQVLKESQIIWIENEGSWTLYVNIVLVVRQS